jgi:hypothetical protein
MQEGAQVALLCLACRRETPDAAERILVARIAEGQQPDQAPVQVRIASIQQNMQLPASKRAHVLPYVVDILCDIR